MIHDRAVRVDADAVILSSGERIEADYIVLASGSAYPFPAKMDADDSNTAKSRMANTRAELIKAEHVLLLGAGPVGLELSGEIKAAWPDKAVTIIDPIDDVLSGQYSDAMRKDLRRQLEELGVNLLLGTSLIAEPRTSRGVTSTFTAVTTPGDEITADVLLLWRRAELGLFGRGVSEGAACQRPSGGDSGVTSGRPRNRLRHWGPYGHPEAKRGGAAGRHAEVAAGNIRTLIEGGDDWPATSRRRHSSCSRSARAAECRSYPVNPTSAGRR